MNLKTMIREKGYTQQSFAERLGVRQTAVSNWCNQINQASMKHIKAMAQVLGVTVDEVVQAIECGKNRVNYSTKIKSQLKGGEGMAETREYEKRNDAEMMSASMLKRLIEGLKSMGASDAMIVDLLAYTAGK